MFAGGGSLGAVEVGCSRLSSSGARAPRPLNGLSADDEVALYDSTVILEHLEERYPEPPLYPRGLAARARLLEDQGDWLTNT